MAEFDIKQLVARAHFGHVGMPFPKWWENNKTLFVLPNLKNINAGQLNGGKYFMQVSLSHKTGTFTLPNEPLVSLALTKTIVETATVGKLRKGTVKEYITTEDYQISFRGVCVNEEDMDAYPGDQVRELNKLFEINDTLDVDENFFFELFDIRRIVLKDIQFDEMAGQPGMQRYTIYAVTDQDFYADLSELKKINPIIR